MNTRILHAARQIRRLDRCPIREAVETAAMYARADRRAAEDDERHGHYDFHLNSEGRFDV